MIRRRWSDVRQDFRDATGAHRFLGVVSVLTSACFLVILLLVVAAPLYGVSRWSRGPVLAVVAGGLLVLGVGARKAGPMVAWLERRSTVRRSVMSTGLALMVAAQVMIGLAVRSPNMWDAGTMEMQAWSLSHHVVAPETVASQLVRYPNNTLLTALLTRWFELWTWLGAETPDLAVVTLNAIVMSAAVTFAYLVARRAGGAPAAYLTAALAGPLVGVSPWMGVAYSDTLGMFFPAAIAYLFVRQRRTRSVTRAGLWSGMGVLASLGYQVKPTAVFPACAALAVAFFAAGPLRQRTGRQWAAGVAVAVSVLVGFALGGAGGAVAVDGVGIDPNNVARGEAFPFTHFLMMGAQKRPGIYNDYYGAWDGNDVLQTASLPAGSERFRNGWKVYRERVAEMGPLGYAKFLVSKSVWNFGDGTFFAWGEGDMKVKPSPYDYRDPRSRWLQELLGYHGRHSDVAVTLWQSTWLVTLTLVAVPAVWWRRSLFGEEAAMLRTSLLMLVVFLALFEGRARYVYLYVPYFLILAGISLSAMVRGGDERVDDPTM